MKPCLLIAVSIVFIPRLVLADYGTPSVATARSIQPWAWDRDHFAEMDNLKVTMDNRGYDIDESDEYHDTSLDLDAVPTVDQFVGLLQEGPGWIGAILHGGANYNAQAGPVGVLNETATAVAS